MVAGRVTKVHVHDVRFPTSLGYHGSDAMHTDPDYSCAYVVISTDTDFQGYGLTFTIGRGTEIDRAREGSHSSSHCGSYQRPLGLVGKD